MRWSIDLGSIAGTAIRVHVTFLLFLAFIGILTYRANGPEAAWDTLAFIVLIFVCVLAHEFGHVLMARRFGAKTRDVTLFPIGGVANMERVPEKPSQEILVSLAGPFVNLVIALGLMLWLGSSLTEEDFNNIGNSQASLTLRIAAANLILMTFNLLPAFPMDGGRVLRALLALKWSRSRATKIAASIGQVFAFGLGFLGLFGNPFLLIIAAFIFIAAGAEADAAALHDSARDLTVGEAMMTEFSSLHPTDTIRASMERLIRSSDEIFPVIDETGRAFGIITRMDILAALADNADTTPISAIMHPIDHTLSEDDNLEMALTHFEKSHVSALIIANNAERMIGLITRTAIAQAILVHTARPGWRSHRGGVTVESLPGFRKISLKT
ncbi:MAG: site-2 protease family protein [Alphaproteobacteria bacterium]